MKGRVFKSTGSWYQVLAEDSKFYQCRLRGKFKLQGLKVSNPIAVGDHVEFTPEEGDQSQGIINDILLRQNYIVRKATQKAKQSHILASNLDQALLMVTFKWPKTSLGFIDRFLVSAESFRIPVIILVNKSDLLSEEEFGHVAYFKATYENIGYKTLIISVLEETGLNEMMDNIKGKTSLVAGHSGVGKSSLLNKIVPEIRQTTAEVSSFAEKGVHTTTFAEMFLISDETYLIDTPGVKELGLFDISPGELSHYFPEMREHLGECKFHNCTHVHEPGCHILTLVEEGEISLSRYESYLSMFHEDDNRR